MPASAAHRCSARGRYGRRRRASGGKGDRLVDAAHRRRVLRDSRRARRGPDHRRAGARVTPPTEGEGGTGFHYLTLAGRQRRIEGIDLAGHVEAVGPGNVLRAGEGAEGRSDVLGGECRDHRLARGLSLTAGCEANGVAVEHDTAAGRDRSVAGGPLAWGRGAIARTADGRATPRL